MRCRETSSTFLGVFSEILPESSGVFKVMLHKDKINPTPKLSYEHV